MFQIDTGATNEVNRPLKSNELTKKVNGKFVYHVAAIVEISVNIF